MLSFNFSFYNIFIIADPFCKLIIIILLLSSIWSWATIILKIQEFRNKKKEFNKFEKALWSYNSLDDFQAKSINMESNPLMQILRAGSKEQKIINDNSNHLAITRHERIERSMNIVRNKIVEKIESQISILGTIGSISPFIGLLGTVWGIMNSFSAIATAKNTNIAIIAPGISEALFSTALGLFVAIPAVIFYNFFSKKSEILINKVDDVILELYNIFSRK